MPDQSGWRKWLANLNDCAYRIRSERLNRNASCKAAGDDGVAMALETNTSPPRCTQSSSARLSVSRVTFDPLCSHVGSKVARHVAERRNAQILCGELQLRMTPHQGPVGSFVANPRMFIENSARRFRTPPTGPAITAVTEFNVENSCRTGVV